MGTFKVNLSQQRKVGKAGVHTVVPVKLLSIPGDDESASMVLVVQHYPELEDLQIFVAGVLDGGKDPDVGRGRDLVGWSREMDLGTI